MEFECQLSALLIGHTALDIGNAADIEGALWKEHPRLPLVVTGSVPRMTAILLTCSDVDAATAEGFHRTEAAVCLFAPFRSVRFWDYTYERTGRAAVGLLCRELNRCHVVLGHMA